MDSPPDWCGRITRGSPYLIQAGRAPLRDTPTSLAPHGRVSSVGESSSHASLSIVLNRSSSSGNVVTINLYYRGLQGTISPLVGAITSLKALRLDVNSLHGTLASSLGNLTNLQYFGVRYSILTFLIGYLILLKY